MSDIKVDSSVGETVLVSNDEPLSEIEKIRMGRETERKETISILNDIINSTSATDELKDSALKKINRISEANMLENVIESRILMRGMGEAVVFIGEDSISVNIYNEVTDDNCINIIRDLVADSTNNLYNDIKIVAVD